MAIASRMRPMSATEAAAWLRVSEETLRTWTHAGEIAFVDLRQVAGPEPGPAMSYTLEALESFVRGRARRLTARKAGEAGKAKYERISL